MSKRPSPLVSKRTWTASPSKSNDDASSVKLERVEPTAEEVARRTRGALFAAVPLTVKVSFCGAGSTLPAELTARTSMDCVPRGKAPRSRSTAATPRTVLVTGTASHGAPARSEARYSRSEILLNDAPSPPMRVAGTSVTVPCRRTFAPLTTAVSALLGSVSRTSRMPSPSVSSQPHAPRE